MPKLKELKEQNPHMNINIIDILKTMDPSKTNKYIPFMIKLMEEMEFVDSVESTIYNLIDRTFESDFENMFKDFEKYQNSKHVKYSDINQYSVEEFLVQADKLSEIISEAEISKKQTITLVDNDKCHICIPLTQMSMDKYGKGSKWCLVSGEYTAFTGGQYKYWREKLYIIINIKHRPERLKNFISYKSNMKHLVKEMDTQSLSKWVIEVNATTDSTSIWSGNDKQVIDTTSSASRFLFELLSSGYVNNDNLDKIIPWLHENKISAKRLSNQHGINDNLATKSLKN